MTQNCLVCNTSVSNSRNCVNIFGKDLHLQSKKKLWEILGEILEKKISPNTCHSRVLCRNCYCSITEYDSITLRLQVLKTKFIIDFKNTLPQFNLKYETYGQLVNIKPKLPLSNKIVLPASKLQPLPANYVLDIRKIAASSKANIAFNNVENSGLQGIIKVAAAAPSASTTNPQSTVTSPQSNLIIASTIASSSTSTLSMPILATAPVSSQRINNPLLCYNMTSLPKDFMSTSDSNKSDSMLIKTELDVQNVEDNNGSSMEIDEDCTLGTADENVKLIYDSEDGKSKSIDLKSKNNFFDVGMLLSPDGNDRDGDKIGKFLLDKYTLLNENDDENHNDDEEEETIVMEDGVKTTFIRVAAGQQLMFDGKKISLVENTEDDLQDNADSQDSNDDTQIELQMSGDEETANAIIAAAQEPGGAFIKVESGEMYRVESIRSKDNENNDYLNLQNIVDRKDDVFVCLICENNKNKPEDQGQYTGKAGVMMAHLKTAHAARIYICGVCDLVMRKRSEYTKHLAEHADTVKVKLNECGICNKKFTSKALLTEHMNKHTGSRPYTCTFCKKKFASKYTHQAHLKTHSDRPRPFKCNQCQKSFFTQQNLAQHEKTHLGIKEFICNVCNKAFASQHNLEVHGVIHTGQKPFKCSTCGKAFARRAEVRDHMRIHTGERPFACDTCGATFTQRSNLHSHRRATHLDDKRHQCRQCPKRFKRRRLLDYHIKAAHTGERPLKCNICHATFVYPEHYKKHIRIHSGEKPFDCEVCGKSFNSRDNRNTHRFVHSDKKPYECLTCGAGYMRKQLLYQHMNTTGHVAESIVVNQPRVIKTTQNGIVAPLVDVSGVEIKSNKLSGNIFTTSDDVELDESDVVTVVNNDPDSAKLYITEDKKIILHDKSTLDLGQDSGASSFVTLHNLSGLTGTSADDKLEEEIHMVTDDKGSMVRLIQVQLQDGQTGWVAIN